MGGKYGVRAAGQVGRSGKLFDAREPTSHYYWGQQGFSIAIPGELFAPPPAFGGAYLRNFSPAGVEKCWDPVQFEISSVETCGNRNLHLD